jgi:hypothetical protein
MIGVSPTHLSKVERDEFAPPAEEKVKALPKSLPAIRTAPTSFKR